MKLSIEEVLQMLGELAVQVRVLEKELAALRAEMESIDADAAA